MRALLPLAFTTLPALLLAGGCVVAPSDFIGFGCNDEHACAADNVCVDGVCVLPCDADDDCSDGRVCDGGCVLPLDPAPTPPGRSTRFFGDDAPSSGAGCHDTTATLTLEDKAPDGAGRSHARQQGSLGFCSAPAAGALALPAGHIDVVAGVDNDEGSDCTITVSVWAGGTTLLGSSALKLEPRTPLADGVWGIDTTATALEADDRLTLTLEWQPVKACNDTHVFWGSADAVGRVELPWPEAP